jgi:hypothetical protein
MSLDISDMDKSGKPEKLEVNEDGAKIRLERQLQVQISLIFLRGTAPTMTRGRN